MFFEGLFGITYADAMPEYPEFPIIDYAAQAEGTVRVMSFNVRCRDVNGTPASSRRLVVAEEVLRVAPDSVGVQEATPEWMASLRFNLSGYSSVGVGREGENKGEYSAIFYKNSKWKLVDSGTFWLSETPDTVSQDWDAACLRICTWAVLQNRQTGEKYVHVNSHFDHISSLARENSAKLVCDYICKNFEGMPVMFTADLNSRPSDEAYRTMTGLLTDCRFISENCEFYGTFHNCSPETHADYIIDYVLCTPGVQVKDFRTVTTGIGGRFVSDHFPIYADIVLPSAQ